jgi:hypothetical protein
LLWKQPPLPHPPAAFPQIFHYRPFFISSPISLFSPLPLAWTNNRTSIVTIIFLSLNRRRSQT